MTKKKKIISIGSLVVVAGFAIGVSVPIALIDHDKVYEVTIDEANGSHYLVLLMDSKTNKAKKTSELKPDKPPVWDFNTSNSQAIDDIAKFYSVPNVQVVPTIRNENVYKNGLEKLLYDLLRPKNNGDELTIIFPKAVEVGGKKVTSIIFDKDYISPKGNDAIKSRYLALSQNGKYYDILIALSSKIGLYDNDSIKLTTEKDFNDALNKMYNAIMKK